MNFRPIAGIDVGKFFSEMAILSPSNEVIARMKIRHDSSTDVERAVELLKKNGKRTLILGLSSSWNPLGTITKSFSIHFIKLDLRFLSINPIQTDSIKNIGIRKVKNDKVDARENCSAIQISGA